ncbi:MAG: thiamine-phosphate kinase [Candidatus Margulisiibacteriota bacterium]|nr:thiamine-phosphate kinase [Candidatus Margulisiibacteriota bacterium]
MKLSKLGEFGLIEKINNIIGEPARKAVLGIGDDTAVIEIQNSNIEILNKFQFTKSKYQLLTTDTMVQGVHFRLKGTSFYDLGERALAINISDIASMGGSPTYALVTIGANKNFSVEKIEELYKGIRDLAKRYKIGVVGGETVGSPKEFVISITLLGEAGKEYLLTRSGAQVGDSILVTGNFGGPKAAKFDIGKSKLNVRLKEADLIAKSGLCTSMTDSSDGLVRSVVEICRKSNSGARLYADCVPIAKKARLKQALYGGEEYELVFTAPEEKAKELKSLISRKSRTKVSICGKIVPDYGEVKVVNMQGKVSPILSAGFEHFK